MMDSLYHHGTKGQRWGIRKYQNKDGSLTPAGKQRYGARDAKGKKISSSGVKDKKKEAAKRQADAKQKKAKANTKPARKDAKDLSNDELKALITRKELEKKYNDLYPRHVSTGEKVVKHLMTKVIVPTATDVGKKYLTQQLSKAMGVKVEDTKKKKKKEE